MRVAGGNAPCVCVLGVMAWCSGLVGVEAVCCLPLVGAGLRFPATALREQPGGPSRSSLPDRLPASASVAHKEISRKKQDMQDTASPPWPLQDFMQADPPQRTYERPLPPPPRSVRATPHVCAVCTAPPPSPVPSPSEKSRRCVVLALAVLATAPRAARCEARRPCWHHVQGRDTSQHAICNSSLGRAGTRQPGAVGCPASRTGGGTRSPCKWGRLRSGALRGNTCMYSSVSRSASSRSRIAVYMGFHAPPPRLLPQADAHAHTSRVCPGRTGGTGATGGTGHWQCLAIRNKTATGGASATSHRGHRLGRLVRARCGSAHEGMWAWRAGG